MDSLQCVERSLLPKRSKFLQQLISKYSNGYMVNNNIILYLSSSKSISIVSGTVSISASSSTMGVSKLNQM